MAVTVVDVLEMVDIEQEQRPHDIAAPGRLRLARMAAHEFLEVAAVVQRRQRVARALALEFLVLHLQLHVRVAHLAVQQADDDGRHGQHQRQQPPYALLQAAVVDLGAFQLILAAEQLDLALLLFRLILFLQLIHGLLPLLFEQLVGNAPLAVVGRDGAAHVARLFQRHAVFQQHGLHVRLVGRALVEGQARGHALLAFLQASLADQRLADVQARRRLHLFIVDQARRRDGFVRKAQGACIVVFFQIAVRQIDEGNGHHAAGVQLAFQRQGRQQGALAPLRLLRVERQPVFRILRLRHAARRFQGA